METVGVKDSYKYVVAGDSISKGIVYDSEKGKYLILKENYVTLLERKLKGVITNTARFGNTIGKGIARLQKDLAAERPDIVLLEYGGNDCDFDWNEVANAPDAQHNPRTDLPLFEQVMRSAVLFLQQKGVVPVLLTLPPLNADGYFQWISRDNPRIAANILDWLGSVTKIYWWQERYNSVILKIAAETQTRLIDIRGAFLHYPDFTRFLCLDGIHPNKEGHRIIAAKIMEFIQSGYGFLLKG